jgi:hypothetical protein
MISPSTLREVRQNPTLAPYYQDTRQFLGYLHSTAKSKFKIHGTKYYPDMPPDDINRTVEYIHRWTLTYRRGVIKKFYQLEEWHEQNPVPITMLTLTTYQDGQYSATITGKKLTIPESFHKLKNSWDSLRDAIKRRLPNVPFVWIMEPHQSGYPHLHIILFADVDRGTQESIKTLWSKKYQAGSYDHGADFAVSKPEESIKSIRNYLVKYIAKGFTSTGSKYEDGDIWTAGQTVFYALVRKYRWRLFGASRDICKVMAYNKMADESISWYATELLNANEDYHLTWARDTVTLDEVAKIRTLLQVQREFEAAQMAEFLANEKSF